MYPTLSRTEKAQQIVDAGAIRKTGRDLYEVQSQAVDGLTYHVDLWRGRCECPDYARRGGPCKHILAAEIAERNERRAAREPWREEGLDD